MKKPLLESTGEAFFLHYLKSYKTFFRSKANFLECWEMVVKDKPKWIPKRVWKKLVRMVIKIEIRE
jgi:hypothetical protein